MEKVIFFESNKDLLELSGAKSLQELWDAGFDLDDWNYGIMVESEWPEMGDDWESNYKEYREDMYYYMSGLCYVSHGFFNGKHFQFKHH